MRTVKRSDTPGGAKWLRRAETLARTIKQAYATKREVHDGYIVEGRRAGQNRTATVTDLPGRMAFQSMEFFPGVGDYVTGAANNYTLGTDTRALFERELEDEGAVLWPFSGTTFDDGQSVQIGKRPIQLYDEEGLPGFYALGEPPGVTDPVVVLFTSMMNPTPQGAVTVSLIATDTLRDILLPSDPNPASWHSIAADHIDRAWVMVERIGLGGAPGVRLIVAESEFHRQVLCRHAGGPNTEDYPGPYSGLYQYSVFTQDASAQSAQYAYAHKQNFGFVRGNRVFLAVSLPRQWDGGDDSTTVIGEVMAIDVMLDGTAQRVWAELIRWSDVSYPYFDAEFPPSFELCAMGTDAAGVWVTTRTRALWAAPDDLNRQVIAIDQHVLDADTGAATAASLYVGGNRGGGYGLSDRVPGAVYGAWTPFGYTVAMGLLQISGVATAGPSWWRIVRGAETVECAQGADALFHNVAMRHTRGPFTGVLQYGPQLSAIDEDRLLLPGATAASGGTFAIGVVPGEVLHTSPTPMYGTCYQVEVKNAGTGDVLVPYRVITFSFGSWATTTLSPWYYFGSEQRLPFGGDPLPARLFVGGELLAESSADLSDPRNHWVRSLDSSPMYLGNPLKVYSKGYGRMLE